MGEIFFFFSILAIDYYVQNGPFLGALKGVEVGRPRIFSKNDFYCLKSVRELIPVVD